MACSLQQQPNQLGPPAGLMGRVGTRCNDVSLRVICIISHRRQNEGKKRCGRHPQSAIDPSSQVLIQVLPRCPGDAQVVCRIWIWILILAGVLHYSILDTHIYLRLSPVAKMLLHARMYVRAFSSFQI